MLQVLKTIIIFILSPFRALFNYLCKKRFRKYLLPTKCEDPIVPNEKETNQDNRIVNNSSDHHVVDFQFDQSWSNDWDNDNVKSNHILTPEDKIQEYRNQICRQKSQPDASETNADVNFFADMEPDNIAQAKIYVGSPKSGQLSERKNRLSVSTTEQYPENNDPVSV